MLLMKRKIYEVKQPVLKDSSEIKKYLINSSYHFVAGEVISIKKGKYYLGRWHNFTEEECFLIKIKVIDPLTSKFHKGQKRLIVANGVFRKAFIFKQKEKYLICYKVIDAKVNGKYKSFPWTWEGLPTKKLDNAESEIEKIKTIYSN
jgi:hypothetical protein